MRIGIRGLAVLAVVAVLGSTSLAAQQEKGDKEVQLFANASVSKTSGVSTSTGTIGLVFGYFASQML
ncbi:MAG: hypothetical protein ACREOE_02830, partial [Gemmatimonadales bacterium]